MKKDKPQNKDCKTCSGLDGAYGFSKGYMYQGDYLEILWLLKKEKVKSIQIKKALNLLKSKMKPNSTWKIERPIRNLIIPIGNKNYGNELITRRAREVIDYYQNTLDIDF